MNMPGKQIGSAIPFALRALRPRVVEPAHAALPESAAVCRRLVAIAFADVAGFSTLMELDDAQTLLRWKAALSDVIEPRIKIHHGRLVHVIGDGLLVEFHSAVDAVLWSIDVQRALAPAPDNQGAFAMRLRIGINVEDAIVEPHDLHGDGINVAARIYVLASAGGVVMTDAVRNYVWNKLPIRFGDLGDRTLKNISRPVRVYRLETMRAERKVETPPSWRCGVSVAALAGILLGYFVAWGCAQDPSRAVVYDPPAYRAASSTPSTAR